MDWNRNFLKELVSRKVAKGKGAKEKESCYLLCR